MPRPVLTLPAQTAGAETLAALLLANAPITINLTSTAVANAEHGDAGVPRIVDQGETS